MEITICVCDKCKKTIPDGAKEWCMDVRLTNGDDAPTTGGCATLCSDCVAPYRAVCEELSALQARSGSKEERTATEALLYDRVPSLAR